MLLSIKEMELHDLRFSHAWQPGEIDFSDSGVTQSGPLTSSGVAKLLQDLGDEVEVTGRVTTDMEIECDRCLGPAGFHVDAPFDLFYKPAEAEQELEEKAIDEGEAEIGFYEMPGLQLEEIVREQVLLQLPMQRLCRADCRGICPVCGGNRNEVECHCEVPTADDRWSGLRDIRV